MNFNKVYNLLIAKAERKGRTRAEVDEITCWLTGYSVESIHKSMEDEVLTYGAFFENAPALNPNASLIKGSICGVKIEEIEDPLMKKIRYLDKLVDELAKGRSMEKILRTETSTAKQPVAALWKCPNCGREFKKTNQSHYCGEKPKTIDAYINMQDEEKRADLRLIHMTLKKSLPEAEERITWSMPTYWKGHNILHFAASKKHIGFYVGSVAVEQFQADLTNYKTEKGTIRIPYGKIDEELVSKIAIWCYETGNHA